MPPKRSYLEITGLNLTDASIATASSAGGPSVRNVSQLCYVAVSNTSKQNTLRARTALSKYTKDMKTSDPFQVNASTGSLVLNLIHDYCKMGTQEAKADNTMTGFIQGLRSIFEEAGHSGNWYVNKSNGTAHGNLLTADLELATLRSTHRLFIARNDKMKLRKRLFSVAHVYEHAKRYWFGIEGSVDYRDVLLHAIMVTGRNQGPRYDEAQKLKIGHVTVHPGVTGTRNIEISLTEAIKNSTVQRDYILRDWPGNTLMRSFVLIDPFVALLSWVCARGNTERYLFCDLKGKGMMY